MKTENEVQRRLAQAGTNLERRPDGKVAVSNFPSGLHTSRPNFFSELLAEWQAKQPEASDNQVDEKN